MKLQNPFDSLKPLKNSSNNRTLFPRLQGSVKPPVLTTSSQPTIQTNPNGLAALPKMRVNGSNPKFTSEMKTQDPYQKG